jgi:hypothetical protein
VGHGSSPVNAASGARTTVGPRALSPTALHMGQVSAQEPQAQVIESAGPAGLRVGYGTGPPVATRGEVPRTVQLLGCEVPRMT